jgi:nitroreductase
MPALEGMLFDHVLLTTRAVRKRLDLHRPVEQEVLRECFELAQQAPTQSDTQSFHFIVVTDKVQREALGELFRRGHAIYKTLPGGVYGLKHSDMKQEATRLRIIKSLEHLVDHIHEVPVHVVPCVVGSTEGMTPASVSVLMGSVIPATWSFMLAARSRGLGTCWTNLHMLLAEEADKVLGLPAGVMQVALIPTAYTIGLDFRPAYRRPLDEILHQDRW